MHDLIDTAAGITPASPLHDLRRQRPQFVAGAETCRAAVLTPAADLGLSPALRNALACRMAAANGDAALVAQYRAAIGDDPTLRRLADGATDLEEPLATMTRHADLVTSTPATATQADIERLAAAGLGNPQIVALSELIAFVNFQTRITAGLRLMGVPA